MRKYAGYPKIHAPSLITKEVPAVALDSMLVKRPVFTALRGFNETFGDRLAYAEFSQRAKGAGHGVWYVAESESINFEGEEGETEDDAIGSWGSDAELLAFSDAYVIIIKERKEGKIRKPEGKGKRNRKGNRRSLML